jgi:protein-L-isoaspartate(D-aspartate) O-methyltransferase
MTETLEDMIRFDLRDRGVRDERVLDAFQRVDRKKFVPEFARADAYNDRALILSHGQTLSQPYMVGLMTQALALKGHERVLEVGTGSGFQTGILACVAREVYTVERIEYLATTAEDRLLDLGFKNIRYHLGDGSLGWPEHAPYDRVIITAASPKIPDALVGQLNQDSGILVAPIGPPDCQELIAVTMQNKKRSEKQLGSCVFVKLIGSEGYEQ